MAVLIPFTGGVESTYLVQKALAEGHEVIVAYYGVTQHGASRVSELTARRHMIEYWKNKYPNMILELYGYFENMSFIPRTQRLEKNGMRQQWNVINQLVATVNSLNVNHDYVTSIWIGWTQYDSAEYSLSYNDFTSAEYHRLVSLVPEILFLSSVEKTMRTPFMPLWNEKHKVDVYSKIEDNLRPFIVANGNYDKIASTPEAINHRPAGCKEDEYKGIPLNRTFARVKFNYFEQAMVDAFYIGFSASPNTDGYADLLEDVPSDHHPMFCDIISAHILSKADKIHLLQTGYEDKFNASVRQYARDIKLMAGWVKPEPPKPPVEKEEIDQVKLEG